LASPTEAKKPALQMLERSLLTPPAEYYQRYPDLLGGSSASSAIAVPGILIWHQ